MHSPLWTWLSVCISLMPTSPVSSDRSLLSRAQPAPCNTSPDELTLTLATHLADGTARAHGAQACAGAPPPPPRCGGRGNIILSPVTGLLVLMALTGDTDLWRGGPSLLRLLPASEATSWLIRGAEEERLRPFFIASSTWGYQEIETNIGIISTINVTSVSASRSDLSTSLVSTSILLSQF